MQALMQEHPFLTFLLAYAIVDSTVKVVGRILRTVNVTKQGWPPAHLDADGDWKPKEE